MGRILVINGPNLNLLGRREPDVYGGQTLDELNEKLKELASDLNLELALFQSNHEGELIDFIHANADTADGMVINPGALTHYSVALRDAILSVELETVEVHLSNIFAREEFRKTSVIAPVCRGSIAGLGFYGYAMALSYFANLQDGEKS